jgi:hypothetical protein
VPGHGGAGGRGACAGGVDARDGRRDGEGQQRQQRVCHCRRRGAGRGRGREREAGGRLPRGWVQQEGVDSGMRRVV